MASEALGKAKHRIRFNCCWLHSQFQLLHSFKTILEKDIGLKLICGPGIHCQNIGLVAIHPGGIAVFRIGANEHGISGYRQRVTKTALSLATGELLQIGLLGPGRVFTAKHIDCTCVWIRAKTLPTIGSVFPIQKCTTLIGYYFSTLDQYAARSCRSWSVRSSV